MFHQLKDSLLNSKVVPEDRAELHSLCRVLEMPLGPQQKTPTRLLKHTHTKRGETVDINTRVVLHHWTLNSLLVALPNLLQQCRPPGPTHLQPGGQRSVLLLTHALEKTAV